MANNGTVSIHGKEYKTVALRVAEFRNDHPDWGIVTELVAAEDNRVIMKASILAPVFDANATNVMIGEKTIGTGYAEEVRASSQINKTSALENCETSAIGRALAACGYGGTEYASANEVENAIHQQKKANVDPEPASDAKVAKYVKVIKEIIDEDQIEENHQRIKDAYKAMTNNELMEVKAALKVNSPGSKRMYSTILEDYRNYVPEEGVMK